MLLTIFLSNRNQRTILNGRTSRWGSIKAGVPQGSVLGPLLFLVYINDVTNGLRSSSKLFADDITIFTTIYDAYKATADMNHDLILVNLWAQKWRMSFNPDITKQAVEETFSRKRCSSHHLSMFFNDTLVKKVQEQKQLGLLLDFTLSFCTAIKSVVSKPRQGIRMLKALSKYVPRHTLNGIYKLYIRPHLDYGDVIYHFPHAFDDTSQNVTLNSQMEKLQSVQYSAALAVTNVWKGISRDKLYDELGWKSLNLRRWSRRLILFYKIINYLTPDYTRHPIPPIQDFSYNFRRCNIIRQICARLKRFKPSFNPSCLSEWENLEPEVRLSNSVSMFKKNILAINRPNPKSVFGVYDPTGISILTQLRVGLSTLNYHKFKHNLWNTLNPLCPINDDIENTGLYFLLCRACCTIRRDLLTCVNDILYQYGFKNLSNEELLQIILYGLDKSPYDSNAKILSMTIQYINDQ